jgi:Flp pilus assembly protein TadG
MNNFPPWYWTVVLPACALFDAIFYASAAIVIVRKLLPKIRAMITARQGNAAIEFAIVAPVLLLIAGLVVDGGLGFQAKQSVMNGTMQAAIASANGNADGAQAIFAANLVVQAQSPQVQCSQNGQTWQCTGTANYASSFSGLAGIPPLWPISYSATAAVPSAPPQ